MWDMMHLIGGARLWAAIQLITSTCLKKRGNEGFLSRDMVKRRGDERSFDDHGN
jgi:hypothetical protein